MEPLSLHTNRSFLYGDGFFETFKLTHGLCLRFPLHFERMRKSAETLQMIWNPEWTLAFFGDLLQKESQKYPETELKVRLIFYRKSSGTYIPDSDEADFYVRVEPYVPLGKEVLKAGIYPLAEKACNFLSSLKTTSALLFVMAGKYARGKGWDESILLNEHGRVCEALSSNIFVRKGDVFCTPPLSEGCVDGVSRRAFLMENPNTVEENLEVDDLKKYPVYFSNAVRGMVKGVFMEN